MLICTILDFFKLKVGYNMNHVERIKAELSKRVLVLDGAMGTMIQRHKLKENFTPNLMRKIRSGNKAVTIHLACCLPTRDMKDLNMIITVICTMEKSCRMILGWTGMIMGRGFMMLSWGGGMWWIRKARNSI